MKKLTKEKIVALILLLFAVGFNLWLYKLEPTATIDPNDNAFQFGLVDRTNTIWDFAIKKCSSSLGGILTFPICQFSYLGDHWVHNWADGFNLPFYYSHVPQILIVASWRFIALFAPQLSLFTYYHIVIYLLLCLFPISVFIALRVMGLSWMTAGVGALFATNLSTDGLYGLDPSSFLWRGYGLSSQLFAMIWLPQAIAYSYRFFAAQEGEEVGKRFLRELASGLKYLWVKMNREGRHLASGGNSNPVQEAQRATRKNSFHEFLIPAIFYITATTAGHLGIGMIAMLSAGFLGIAIPIMKVFRQQTFRDVVGSLREQIIRVIIVCGVAIFILGYWIIPIFIYGNYHNISFWDPVWKFNSYGTKEVMIRLFNGDLFDFGRLPILTYLSILGIIVSLSAASWKFFEDRFSSLAKSGKTKSEPVASSGSRKITNSQSPNEPTSARTEDYSPLAFLFIFWLLFYFGRTTWGGLIDLIPGMKDFHLSRFIVGLHAAGMLLAPIGFVWLAEFGSRITNDGLRKLTTLRINYSFIRLFAYLIIGLLLIPPVFQWTITYNTLNNDLIVRANTNHAKVAADEQKLFAKLNSLEPARVFAGRGGSFGKNFRVAETPYFMDLSTYGIPTTLWLPETWSMNSDTEQFFSEDQAKDYDLYNMKYVAAPPDQTPQPFWTLIDQAATWKLYSVPTSGYFTVGIRPAIVSINKINFYTVVHLWVQSDAHKNGLFPELTFDASYPKTTGLPNFKMTDEVTYVTPDKKTHNLFAEPPIYLPPGFMSVEQFNNTTIKQYNNLKLIGPEKNDTNMIFSTKVDVGTNCQQCLVILKQTYHPSWRAWVDGKPVKPIIVFPFYIGVQVGQPGVHEVTLAYEPSLMKMALLYLAIIAIVLWVIVIILRRKDQKSLTSTVKHG